MREKKKRVVVTMQKRLDALHRMDKGEILKSISFEFVIDESTVGDWEKKRKEIETFSLNLTKAALKSLSTLKKPKQEELDDTLLIWFNQETLNGNSLQ